MQLEVKLPLSKVVIIRGANGCGKTNLLDALALLLSKRAVSSSTNFITHGHLKSSVKVKLNYEDHTSEGRFKSGLDYELHLALPINVPTIKQEKPIHSQVPSSLGTPSLGTPLSATTAPQIIKKYYENAEECKKFSKSPIVIAFNPLLDGLFSYGSSVKIRFFDKILLQIFPRFASLWAQHKHYHLEYIKLQYQHDHTWLEIIRQKLLGTSYLIHIERAKFFSMLNEVAATFDTRVQFDLLLPLTSFALTPSDKLAAPTVVTEVKPKNNSETLTSTKNPTRSATKLLSELDETTFTNYYLPILRNYTSYQKQHINRSKVIGRMYGKQDEDMSTGQQKVLLIHLFLATCLLAQEQGKVILILDDVLAHLDKDHQGYLFRHLQKLQATQVWLSVTDTFNLNMLPNSSSQDKVEEVNKVRVSTLEDAVGELPEVIREDAPEDVPGDAPRAPKPISIKQSNAVETNYSIKNITPTSDTIKEVFILNL